MTATDACPSTPTNTEQLRAWDGDEGAYWAAHADHFERGARRLPASGSSTRPPSRPTTACSTSAAAPGRHDPRRRPRRVRRLGAWRRPVLGDARGRPAARPPPKASTTSRFEQADAQIHPFEPEAFDVAIGRTSAMFFGDRVAGLANIGRALRPGGRLVLLTWQPLTGQRVDPRAHHRPRGRSRPAGAAAGGARPVHPRRPRRHPLSAHRGRLHRRQLDGTTAPMWFGHDADDAYQLVAGLLGWMLEGLDDAGRAQALDELHATIAAHETADGVALRVGGLARSAPPDRERRTGDRRTAAGSVRSTTDPDGAAARRRARRAGGPARHPAAAVDAPSSSSPPTRRMAARRRVRHRGHDPAPRRGTSPQAAPWSASTPAPPCSPKPGAAPPTRRCPSSTATATSPASTFPTRASTAPTASESSSTSTNPRPRSRNSCASTRPGGRIVVIDTDWGMHAIHGADPSLTEPRRHLLGRPDAQRLVRPATPRAVRRRRSDRSGRQRRHDHRHGRPAARRWSRSPPWHRSPSSSGALTADEARRSWLQQLAEASATARSSGRSRCSSSSASGRRRAAGRSRAVTCPRHRGGHARSRAGSHRGTPRRRHRVRRAHGAVRPAGGERGRARTEAGDARADHDDVLADPFRSDGVAGGHVTASCGAR